MMYGDVWIVIQGKSKKGNRTCAIVYIDVPKPNFPTSRSATSLVLKRASDARPPQMLYLNPRSLRRRTYL